MFKIFIYENQFVDSCKFVYCPDYAISQAKAFCISFKRTGFTDREACDVFQISHSKTDYFFYPTSGEKIFLH